MQREHLEVHLQTRTARRIGAGDGQRDGRGRGRHRGASLAKLLPLALLSLVGCAAGADPDAPPLVILISMDGVRHDYPDRGTFPALARMQREGTRAGRLVPVFPASTFPNHVSLATGTYADRHGIVANRFVEPGRGEFDYGNDASWLRAEPLWVAAERQGVRAAVYFWVGSETDYQGIGASRRRAPFSSRVSERAKVDQILEWVDLARDERPGLIMSWWHGADAAGHSHGPDSKQVVEALERQDQQLARLLAGLDARRAWSYTTLLLVSDHGMAAVSRSIDLATPLRRSGIRCWVVPSGGAAYVHLEDPSQLEAALAKLRSLTGVQADAVEALPEGLRALAAGRSGQIVARTAPPSRFVAPGKSLASRPRGGHGYSGSQPEMGAIFYAIGRNVPRRAAPPEVRAIDVAPTVAALLGIAPPAQSEGRVLFPR